MGIEPTNAGATIRCVNRFATTAMLGNIKMAGVVGIEPTSKVLETFVLPLNYTPTFLFKWWRGADSNCRTLRERIYSPPRLATSLPLHIKLLENLVVTKSFGDNLSCTYAGKKVFILSYLLKKGGRWGSNPRMPEPQSGALTASPRPPCWVI